MVLTLLIIVMVTALVFEYINGFHDSANAIATVVSTKVLTARAAIIYAGVLNMVGAFMGIGLILLRNHHQSKPIPFGPYLAIAGLIALFWGPQLTRAYLGLMG